MGRATDELTGYGASGIWYDEASTFNLTVEQELELNLAAYRQSRSYVGQRRIDPKRQAKKRAKAKAARQARKNRR